MAVATIGNSNAKRLGFHHLTLKSTKIADIYQLKEDMKILRGRINITFIAIFFAVNQILPGKLRRSCMHKTGKGGVSGKQIDVMAKRYKRILFIVKEIFPEAGVIFVRPLYRSIYPICSCENSLSFEIGFQRRRFTALEIKIEKIIESYFPERVYFPTRVDLDKALLGCEWGPKMSFADKFLCIIGNDGVHLCEDASRNLAGYIGEWSAKYCATGGRLLYSHGGGNNSVLRSEAK